MRAVSVLALRVIDSPVYLVCAQLLPASLEAAAVTSLDKSCLGSTLQEMIKVSASQISDPSENSKLKTLVGAR